MTQVEIRRMTPSDLDAACNVIGLAFANDPNTLAITRGDPAKAHRTMQASVRVAKLGRKVSYVLVAEEAGHLVGVLNAAEWPHCQLSGREKLATAPTIVPAMGSSLPRALRMLRVWAKHDPQERHWHLGPLGVDPERQGRGIGSALLSAFVEMVDDQKLPAYLETDRDRNVVLYERFSFEVTAQASIAGIDNRFMWRTARP